MKCPYCGAELSDNARFCKYCGKPVESKVETPEKKEKKSKGGSGKKTLTAVLLLALLGCGGWFGYKYFFDGKVNTKQDTTSQTSMKETPDSKKTAPAEQTAEPEITPEPVPEVMNSVLEKVRQTVAAENHSDAVLDIIRSDEFNEATKEMWKLGLDQVLIHDGDTKAVGTYFVDEQFVVYAGDYNWETGKREGYGELYGINVILGGLPCTYYSAGGEWSDDKPNGQWTVNTFIREGYNGEGYDRTETGTAKNGLWNGQIQIYAPSRGTYTFQFDNGRVKTYDSFYENGEYYYIVQYTNNGYIYQHEDLVTDYQGIIGYARGN